MTKNLKDFYIINHTKYNNEKHTTIKAQIKVF
jgi:hypothetical protein